MNPTPLRLFSLGLFLFLALAAATPRAQTLASLLQRLESSTSFDGQTDQWHDLRAPWMERLSRASLAQVPPLLLEYEANLKPTSTQQTWQSRRTAWRAEVGRATRPQPLADLMLELERNLKPEAMNGSWNDNRQGWIREVRTSAGQRQQANSRPGSQPRPGQTGSGPFHTLAGLVQRLESATSYSAQVDGWSNDRQAWIARVEATASARQAQEVLLTCEAKMKPESMSASWSFLRAAWLKKVKKARTPRDLAQCILEFETYVMYSAHGGNWFEERNEWAKEVARAGGITLTQAPEREDRYTPPNDDDWTSDHSLAPANRWARVAEMIQTVENSTSYDGQIDSWREERQAYVSATRDVADLEGIRTALLGYDHSLKASSLSSSFDRAGWQSRVRQASTAVDLADLAVELVENTNADAIGDNWRNTEMGDWSSRIRSLATRADQGIEEPVEEPSADAPERATPLGRLAAALMDMEGNISYSAQTDEWMNGNIRDAWKASLGDDAMSGGTFAQGLLTCEANMKPEGMVPAWANRRAAWVQAVRSTTVVAQLATLLLEFEENIKGDSFFGGWNTSRTQWRAKVQAVGE